MSPIYQVLKDNLCNQKKESLGWMSTLVALSIPIILFSMIGLSNDETAGGYVLIFFLSIPICIYVGFSNTFGKMAQGSFSILYNQAYNLIETKTKNISKKKNIKSKDVDKLVKSLETTFFEYEDVLDILGYTEDTLNHETYLKKKAIHIIPDIKITKKPNEKLHFRTHAFWLQGSPENSVIKDVGFFYLSNKRIIFIGNEKSYSINFTKIINLKLNNNYALVHKTAGKNDIFEIENTNSLRYFNFLFNKLN